MNSFTALADPTRRQIVEMLAERPLAAGEIARRFTMSSPAISQHLKVLREARLVRAEVAAQQRIYELDPAGIDEVVKWIAKVRKFWGTKLDALETEIKREKRRRE